MMNLCLSKEKSEITNDKGTVLVRQSLYQSCSGYLRNFQEREHTAYLFPVFRFDISPGQVQGCSDDSGIVQPAKPGKDVRHQIKGQDDVAIAP